MSPICIKTDNAHLPIRPTKCTGLQGNVKRLYEFIVRHFVCIFVVQIYKEVVAFAAENFFKIKVKRNARGSCGNQGITKADRFTRVKKESVTLHWTDDVPANQTNKTNANPAANQNELPLPVQAASTFENCPEVYKLQDCP